MSQIVLDFLPSNLILSLYMDVLLTLSIDILWLMINFYTTGNIHIAYNYVVYVAFKTYDRDCGKWKYKVTESD